MYNPICIMPIDSIIISLLKASMISGGGEGSYGIEI